tara:strand:+ start:5647 stop:6114 length:468 start_codon:yes stop_codon:yes gene_type:complete
LDTKNQYQIRASKEDTIQLVQEIVELSHDDSMTRKLTGVCGKGGKFYFTLRRLSSGGSPTYSPKLVGEVQGDQSNASIHIRFRPSLILVIFGLLMLGISAVLFYKHNSGIDEDSKPLIFAVISIAIFFATVLTHFHLKKELTTIFLNLTLNQENN